MDDFLIQFLMQAWRLIAIIIGLIILAIFVARRNAKKKQEELRLRKEAQNPELAQKNAGKYTQKPSKASLPNISEEQADFADDLFADADDLDELYDDKFVVASSGGSIFDDEDFFPIDDDADVQFEPAKISYEEAIIEEDEDEAVDLASLLVGMAMDDVPEKAYHRISDKDVSVKLATKKFAIGKELLSILRDERDARLMVQMGNVAYRTLLGEKETKAVFTKTMRELSAILLKPDSNPPDSAEIEGIAPNMMSTEAIDVEVASGGDTSAREMISILRDNADGHLIIQIGNTGYRTLADNPKAKTGFSKIMKELSTVITTPDDNAPIVDEPVSDVSKPVAYTSKPAETDDEDEILPGDIRFASIDELPDAYKVGRFGRVKVNKVEEKVKEVSIAEATEAYLQYKIQQTPQYQNRGIHIRSAFGGGLKIDVDGKSYDFVDEVEDAEVRTFIQEAIAEWQDRH